MRKFWAFLWKEEIPQATGVTFLIMAFCSAAVVVAQPLSLPEPARTLFYFADDPRKDFLFILGFSMVMALIAGVLMCAASAIHAWLIRRP